jgi:hypothetical protein
MLTDNLFFAFCPDTRIGKTTNPPMIVNEPGVLEDRQVERRARDTATITIPPKSHWPTCARHVIYDLFTMFSKFFVDGNRQESFRICGAFLEFHLVFTCSSRARILGI